MTVKELREEAKSLGLVGYSRLNKADLERMVTTGDDTHADGVQTTIALQRETKGRS